jgi:hypothetical protein
MSNTLASTTNSISVSELFKMVRSKLHDVEYYWHYYVGIYSYDCAQIEVLNKADGRFFVVVRDMLAHEVILGLCRLLDKPKTHNKYNYENASVYSLVESTLNNASSESVTSAKARLDKNSLCGHLFKYRNKLLAHNDVPTLITRKGGIIEGVTDEAIAELISDLECAIDSVAKELGITPGVYPKNPRIKIVELCKRTIS